MFMHIAFVTVTERHPEKQILRGFWGVAFGSGPIQRIWFPIHRNILKKYALGAKDAEIGIVV